MTGKLRHSIKPIKLKAHGRKAMSIFRYGLDYLQRTYLNQDKMHKELTSIIDMFIKPLIPRLPILYHVNLFVRY
ncbi:hypothetical protein [Candidatus Tisiphia endosymbiont of Oplodontha viridula]|uniref:hypothetical protein n=1 Tax=Candidatus Tisiphia endosymbiont of Oplodontha viridula TaxID=3077925 RepID=UPI0035C8F9C9